MERRWRAARPALFGHAPSTRMMRPTERFSSRADAYARFRPSYPPPAIDLLAARCGLAPGMAVADVGSGTGILTELLLV